MTPQPREFIITMGRIIRVRNMLMADGYHNAEVLDNMVHMLRSRPAPSPKTRMEAYDKFVRDTLKPHVDAIKAEAVAQAHEDVLDKVIAFCKSNDCVQKTYGDTDCQSTTDTECVICFCESLRPGGEPR